MDPATQSICKKIMRRIMVLPFAQLFTHHVSRDDVPKYYDIITTPICLNEINSKVKKGKYLDVQQWSADIRLIQSNSEKFNGSLSPYTNAARVVVARWKKLKDKYMPSLKDVTTRYCELIAKMDAILASHPSHPCLSVFDSLSVDTKPKDTLSSMHALQKRLESFTSTEQVIQLTYLLRELERSQFSGTRAMSVDLRKLTPETVAKLQSYADSQP